MTIRPPPSSVVAISSRRGASSTIHEDRSAARAVLGLRGEVRRDELFGRASIRDDDQLRRSGGRLDADDPRPGDLTLGHAHEDVAGPDDDIHGGDRRGAVGERGDRLGPTDPVDLVDADQRGRRQRHLGHPAVTVRRYRQRDLGHSRDPRRDRRHEDRRRVGRPAAGNVEPGPVHRTEHLFDHDTVDVEAHRALGGSLGFVVPTDACGRDLQGFAQVGIDAVERGGQLGGRDAELVDRAPVELGGQLPQRRVAPAADVGDDLAHELDGFVLGSGRDLKRNPRVGVRAAQVETRQHGPGIVPGPWIRPDANCPVGRMTQGWPRWPTDPPTPSSAPCTRRSRS